ncbi:M28 family peptidase [Flavobacteriaceae bacterium F08102]|nr:M28 family peptidase [Flavobacteriaceae bacterium F08102]
MKHLIIIGLGILAFLPVHGQTDIEKTKNTVVKSDIEGHIYFLASDELRGRETGTREADIAAAYLANSFRRYNVKPVNNGSYYQDIKFQMNQPASKLEASLNGTTIEDFVPLNGQNIDYDGTAIFVGYGEESDYTGKNVKGKLVISRAGTPGNDDVRAAMNSAENKRKTAAAHGAIGIIELNNTTSQFWRFIARQANSSRLTPAIDDTSSDQIPYMMIKDTDALLANSFANTKRINAKITVEGAGKTYVNSKNVVGMVEGTDPKLKDEFIIYSAHYDHIGTGKPNEANDSIFNGARDNAIGTVTVLSAAENIGKYPTKRSALFILFTGEEKGLLGSRYYADNPLIPLDKMVYCFNSDNGGYNDTSIATIIGLHRTTAAKHIISAAKEFGLNVIDDPAGEQGLFDRSDNVSFAAKGIPAPTYSLGFTAFDAEINKYYHKTSDNPDTLDYDYLEKFFKSYVLACRRIANDPQTPFWTEGDKYYKKGVELYGKSPVKK